MAQGYHVVASASGSSEPLALGLAPTTMRDCGDGVGIVVAFVDGDEDGGLEAEMRRVHVVVSSRPAFESVKVKVM